MSTTSVLPILLIAATSLLTACKDDTASNALPDPVTMTDEAIGYYCQMVVLDHKGPKAQMFLATLGQPRWFGQVRDAIAYLKSPEQDLEMRVLYVNDIGRAQSYARPGADNWINARDAFYVVGSNAIGGMGAPELVPFGDAQKAAAFAVEHGGKVMRLDEIPTSAVLSPLDRSMEGMDMKPTGTMGTMEAGE